MIPIGLYANVMEIDDLKFTGVFAEESVKLGFKPDENSVVCIDGVDVQRVFENCLDRTDRLTDGQLHQLSLVSVFLDSSRGHLLFG